MRFKRKSTTTHVSLDAITRNHQLHVEEKKREIRKAADDCMKALKSKVDVVKGQVDDLRDILMEKFERLAQKAKDDIDAFVKTDEDKTEAFISGKLTEVDQRLEKAIQLPGRASSLHHEQRIDALISELQQFTQRSSMKQIDFKIHDRGRDFLKSVSSLGKPRWRRKKVKQATEHDIFINTSSSDNLRQNLALSTTSIFDETYGGLSSISTSNNVSVSSIVSAYDDNDQIDLISNQSVASSGFVMVDSYRPVPFELMESMFHSADRRSLDEISFDVDCMDVISIDIDESKYTANNVTLFDDFDSGVNTPFVVPKKASTVKLHADRDLDETSWKSSNTLDSESNIVNECHIDTCEKIPEEGLDTECISLTYATEFQACDHRGFCVIPDITILPDHKMVLCDHYHNNVQFYDKDFKLVAEEKCPYPMGICRVDKKTVAVSLRRSSQIILFSIEEKQMKRIKDITVQCSMYTWNLTFKANRFFVVCDQNHVHVLAMDGTETSVIDSGVPVESGYIRYFDVSDDGNMLYLCTGLGLQLRCIDKNGNHIWSFKSSDVPGKVCGLNQHAVEDVCYTNGRLLATNWMQSKIFEISLDGKYVRDIVTSNLESPRAMSVAGDQLVVTQFNPNIDNCSKRTVKVFKVDIK